MGNVINGETEFFKGIGQVKFEGTSTDNPLAFRWYDENRIVAGKTLKEHLRFAGAYWHSFVGSGADPFGAPTHIFPWDKKSDPVEKAKESYFAWFRPRFEIQIWFSNLSPPLQTPPRPLFFLHLPFA